MLGISNLLCLTDNNYTLLGDFYSTDFKYVESKLAKCSKNCKSKDEIDSFFENL
jgi:hypothetical protein